MKHNAKKVGDVWILNPPEGVKDYVCNCGKPGNPVISQYNILEISEEQTKDTVVLKNRYSIIDILAKQEKSMRLMEVGTAAGDYAQLMADSIPLEKMILIDKFDNEDMMPNGSERYSSDKNYQFVVLFFLLQAIRDYRCNGLQNHYTLWSLFQNALFVYQ